MPAVCFYFQVHQPYRVKKYSVFDIGQDHNYFETDNDMVNNQKIFHKVADKCYLPTNKLMLELLKQHPEFKISYSLSGVFLEQALNFDPEVIESFKKLVKTGQVEILDETYHHSLAFLHSWPEYRHQIKLHKDQIEDIFGVTPRVFRNTELIFSNNIAKEIENLGYIGILAEGADSILGNRTPNFVYRPKGTEKIKLLLKNYRLSDDIAFRFSTPGWSGYPVTAKKYANWISRINGSGELVNLFMDYETFGEHQWRESGIFDFLMRLPGEILRHKDNFFVTPNEAIEQFEHIGELDFPNYVSWADTERDLSAWHSNAIQKDALKKIYSLEKNILESGDKQLIDDWRKLQTSDHFYYMCTKYFADGDIHKYFSPYESPYEVFINYMNIVADLEHRLNEIKKIKKKTLSTIQQHKTKSKRDPISFRQQ